MAWNKEYVQGQISLQWGKGGGDGYCNTKQGSLRHGIKNAQLKFRSAARILWAYILEESYYTEKTNTQTQTSSSSIKSTISYTTLE